MRRIQGLGWFRVASVVLVPNAAAAAMPPVELRYDVYAAGVPALSLRLDIQVSADRYRIVADMETRGMVGFFYSWRHRGIAEGRVEDGILRPAQYRAVSDAGGTIRTATLDYAADGVVVASADPPTEAGRDPVPADLTRGSVDILTAVLAVTRRMDRSGRCDGAVPVYDGRRRYDLVFADGGADRASAMTVSAVRRCQATMRRLAGFLKTLSPWDDGDEARAAAISVAVLRDDLPAVPVRLDLATPIGVARAELTAVSVDGRPLPPPVDAPQVARARPPGPTLPPR
ncbi:DUF3108 domain-containing protein [Stella sp.]|uniref:DUF3108 domain-containing protein n=1 Tax=Stella sp. TaxID=2912054 RepID=UPI0035B4ACF1